MMKKKQLYGFIKEQFDFDMVEERRIYRNVNKEKLTRTEKKKIPEDKKFVRYQQWREYIVKKFSSFSKEGLVELSRLFKMLQRESQSDAEFNQNMYLSVPVIMMTLIVENLVDYYTVDFTTITFDGKMQMALFLLVYLVSIIVFSILIAGLLIHMNMDFGRVGRRTLDRKSVV